ncbi:XRE family transcriptional regulator [Clostridium perfringens]|uniref:hypothetical protein n=1 Tax=Clostridium perfringens TaxID=1502 RepID=UPI0010D95D9F|nr:hypothetical protein [Clostridium perfringens]VTQ54236.1 XRE family transcriptional regulator [Clostridium perfringens]
MVSRMEKVSNSPTLTNFLRYISALGLDIDVKKKKYKNLYHEKKDSILLNPFLLYFKFK